jgi:hypothetical protein
MRSSLLCVSAILRSLPEAADEAITHGVLGRCRDLGKETVIQPVDGQAVPGGLGFRVKRR